MARMARAIDPQDPAQIDSRRLGRFRIERASRIDPRAALALLCGRGRQSQRQSRAPARFRPADFGQRPLGRTPLHQIINYLNIRLYVTGLFWLTEIKRGLELGFELAPEFL